MRLLLKLIFSLQASIFWTSTQVLLHILSNHFPHWLGPLIENTFLDQYSKRINVPFHGSIFLIWCGTYGWAHLAIDLNLFQHLLQKSPQSFIFLLNKAAFQVLCKTMIFLYWKLKIKPGCDDYLEIIRVEILVT